MSPQSLSFEKQIIESITTILAKTGYCIIDNALPTILANKLASRITTLGIDILQAAKVGKAINSKLLTHIRGDKTYWLDEHNETDQHYLALMDSLRSQINKHLFLGLFEFECHYAIYQAGSFYKKHSDVLFDNQQTGLENRNRILSSVLYLNKNWKTQYGGELILYDKDNSILETIYPENNKLVLFLSEQFPHEVKTTAQTRYSITGWFRVNRNT